MARLALILALAAGPAAAQVDPDVAFPREVGNRWEFVDYGSLSTLTWEIVGEQTVDGERIALLEVRSGSGEPATCGVRVEPSDAGAGVRFTYVDPAGLAGPCPAGTAGGFFGYGGLWAYGAPTATTATVGDTTVTGDAWSGSADDGQMTWTRFDYWTLLGGLGPVQFSGYRNGGHGIPGRDTFAYELARAVVGGLEVGTAAVPAGDGPFERFLPLAVGDRWDYSLTASTGTGPDLPDGAASLEVTALVSTSPNDQTATVEVVRQTASGAVTRSTCQLRAVAFSTRSELRFYGCSGLDGVFPATVPLTTASGAAPVQIGGQTVTAEEAVGSRALVESTPSYSRRTTRTVRAADGIGVTHWTYSVTVSPNTQASSGSGGRLAYARVGGVEYGTVLVADEPAAPVAGALALTVGPNPARSHAAVRYALPSGATGRLAVVDALGREVRSLDVAAGSSGAALDVSGLAPGLYVVRLAAGASAATARIVVAR